MRTAITAATLLALQGATTPFAGIPNVRIEDYPVSGRSVAAIRHSIDAARPTDPNDHQRVDGLTRWNINWRWRRDAAGTCTTTLDAITFSAVVTVPRLSDPDVPAGVRAQFDRFRATLLAHEDGHVRYAWDHRGEVVAVMNAAGCDRINDAGMAVLRRIGEHDAAYDKTTRHGADIIPPFG
ncbi:MULTISPECIES: DUF922 domain-containing protein [Sphingomonas]|uniref:DUF922 domain-containing protein n=1 Tax=Sphingomonas adhaesiva TaxID=28212 RepID=A0A2A4I905_9SPHN|nr:MULTISPECIES: DUF922 domain-containing protein [Sphingomonas]PCG15457.1 DUF922 domain-containing protein [Sphingomonas adhaesiva]PZU78714.1 MAG: DUF922 domain-containing protein [Sphingomonas sp.]